MKKKITRALTSLFLIAAVTAALLTTGCQFIVKKDNAPSAQGGANDTEIKNPIVTIEMDSGDIITLELYPDIAPNTVANFVTLAQSGYYDGVIFHRVIPSFMIQGGDPMGTGMGGPGYAIKGEFTSNGFTNDLQHERGVISMARSKANDSAGSQFFLMHANSPHLNGDYAAFGKVTDDESLKAIDRIATAQRDGNDRPLTDRVMKKVTVETFGAEYTVEKIGG